MITHINASGFKSLSQFSLDFTPGLNILVGPNGSGKTNIVSLFEFLAYLIETDASEATSKAGGAGAVFRRIGRTYNKSIDIEIFGCAPLPEDRSFRRSKKPRAPKLFVSYQYSFSLCFPESRDSVVFKEQRLRLRRTKEFSLEWKTHTSPSDWNLDVHVGLDSDGIQKSKISRFDERFVKRYFYLPDSDAKP